MSQPPRTEGCDLWGESKGFRMTRDIAGVLRGGIGVRRPQTLEHSHCPRRLLENSAKLADCPPPPYTVLWTETSTLFSIPPFCILVFNPETHTIAFFYLSCVACVTGTRYDRSLINSVVYASFGVLTYWYRNLIHYRTLFRYILYIYIYCVCVGVGVSFFRLWLLFCPPPCPPIPSPGV